MYIYMHTYNVYIFARKQNARAVLRKLCWTRMEGTSPEGQAISEDAASANLKWTCGDNSLSVHCKLMPISYMRDADRSRAR